MLGSNYIIQVNSELSMQIPGETARSPVYIRPV
jgi:hypothetical protein